MQNDITTYVTKVNIKFDRNRVQKQCRIWVPVFQSINVKWLCHLSLSLLCITEYHSFNISEKSVMLFLEIALLLHTFKPLANTLIWSKGFRCYSVFDFNIQQCSRNSCKRSIRQWHKSTTQ